MKKADENFKIIFPITENSKLAKKYGVKESTVRMWGARLGLRKAGVSWSKKHAVFILENWGKSTAREISETVGRSVWAVRNKFYELNGKRGVVSRLKK